MHVKTVYVIAPEYDAQAQVSCLQCKIETIMREKKNNDGSKDKMPGKITMKKEIKSSVEELTGSFQGQLNNFKRQNQGTVHILP